MTWTRPAFKWLIWLFCLGLAVQFFLAGLGVFGGGSIDPHRGLGSALQLVSILIVIVVALGPFEPKLKGMALALVVLTVLQSLWATESLKPMWLRSFHVFDAFLIVGLSIHMAKLAGYPMSKDTR
jgi:hypothetical protein